MCWTEFAKFAAVGKTMKRILAPLMCAVGLSVCLGGLAGCGGSSGGGTTTPPVVASITSFTASQATITAGASATLTGVFTGGTGVITPGNLPVTSGAGVTVSPTATTTYTLTVTPSSGSAVTATATITVNAAAAPTITSFVASPATITVGASSSLTAVFAGGTGVVTPGNLAVLSGTALSVSPAATTTYTVTVTPPTGTAITQTVMVTVVPAPTITSFVANPTPIAAGATSNLTAVFANGIGVITPGNYTVTSGVAQPVTPASTSTYTLTVTNSAGTAIIQTATVTVVPAPTITSFVANQATITAGGSSTLTAVFANGTGVITPGNISVTSGTGVSVSPSATTTYTLTVTPPSGAAISQTATVTVVPAPTITSFVANPTAIAAGGSSGLTGVFANGTGVITPGKLAATSGTAVSVNPTVSTTYTLTVTNPAGTAVTQTATVNVQTSVSVNESISGPSVSDQLLGMNLAAWYDEVGNATAVNGAFAQAGIKAIRWPGGSWSDEYHWQTPNSSSNPSLPYMCANNSNGVPNGSTGWGGYSTFAQFVTSIVQGGSYDLALTADYGTNAACTGPGDPTEAAAWVTAALSDGVTVSHMTVGNEEYGSWETDLHTLKNNATTYAAATAGSSGYYALIKAASPNTAVGVSVNPGNSPAWDPTVLANAPYDFVEYHYYPETPGSESDTFLVQQGAQQLTANINTIKAELNTAGKPSTPIYVGEIGGPYSNPGKQSWSITQGLYAGQVLGEMMNAGVARLTWWIGFGNCNGTSGNDSALLYGWQDFGAYNVFSDGPTETTCPGAGAIGSMSPTARAFQLFSNVAVNGESALTATVAGDTTDVVAYAATHSGGTALVLFNRNETVSEPVLVSLSGQSAASTVTVITYDKAIYDLSGSPTGFFPDPNGTNTWAAPTTTNLGAQTLPMTLTLTPWSMNVVLIH